MSFRHSNTIRRVRRNIFEEMEGFGGAMDDEYLNGGQQEDGAEDVPMADDAELGGQNGGQNRLEDGQDDYEMTQENPDEAMGGEMEQQGGPVPYSQNGDVDAIVTNIREQCLQGLQMLANDIQDPAYELLKKMWDMCDKAQTPDDNGQPQGK